MKIEEVEDNQDNNTETLSPSPPPPPKAGPLHPQPGKDVTPQRYGLRRSTHETRIPHREGNIYGEDHHPTDILRHPEWRRHLGEADPDMVHVRVANSKPELSQLLFISVRQRELVKSSRWIWSIYLYRFYLVCALVSHTTM